MELTKIEIESYKSIKSPVIISFVDGLPTILIGKNGSGKTNILEALSEIALVNSNRYGNREKKQPIYRAYIQLSEEDVATMLPNVVYDKDKCEIVAYSSGNGIKIDRVCSEYIVSIIKKEIADIRDLASQLKDAVDLYEKQLIKISHDGRDELPIHCYNLKDANGGLTNYGMLKWHGESFINDVRKTLDHMMRTFNDDEIALTFVYEPYLYFRWDKDNSFRLEYVEPSLAKFEEKFVSINRTAPIIETYLRQVYKGSDREELLKSSKHELILSQQAVADFEAFLNENIPLFDKEMYDSISVQAGEKGHISIFLNEKTGEKINFNETSAGRRWYFTYYFMKNILSEGDIFIIDEPAAMLHPSAQREVLCDLIELTKRGVKVVYSTHSPYLIPDEWQCVHFVTMTEEGTEAKCVSSNQELVSQMTDIVGEDIFDVQTLFDMYAQGDPIKIGRKCYDAICGQTKDLEEAASKLLVSVYTIESWNRKGDHFRCPKLENIIAICNYTNAKIKDLLN